MTDGGRIIRLTSRFINFKIRHREGTCARRAQQRKREREIKKTSQKVQRHVAIAHSICMHRPSRVYCYSRRRTARRIARGRALAQI